VAERFRRAWADVDLDAISHNVEVLAKVAAPADVCAVVKAGAYGHGAVPVARAALDAGARWPAVALVEEGIELRSAGIDAPVLVLSEAPPGAARAVVAAGLTPTVAGEAAVAELAAAVRATGARHRLAVHLKVDTGMHRVGVAPAGAAELVATVHDAPGLELGGLYTHLAVADGTSVEDREFTAAQLARFDAVVAELGRQHRPPLLHAANSAGAIACPAARYDMVRCGIGLYGVAPSGEVATTCATTVDRLRPALSLRATVSAVRQLDAGERPSYGRRRALLEPSVVATVPLGYADGVPRALLEAGATVLVGGRRRPLAGTVTMDQVMVDCGPGAVVAPGDEVVFLGRQGTEVITADEWAGLLRTIPYEVLCGIGPRVERRYVRGEG